MNDAITSSWSARRSASNKISLNAPLPGSPAAIAQAALVAKVSQGEQPDDVVESNLSSDAAGPSSPRPPLTVGAKRKARPSKDTEQQSEEAVASQHATQSTKRVRASRHRERDRGEAAAGPSRQAEKYAPPSTRLADLGGLGPAISTLLELVGLPLLHPEIYAHTGVRPPRGVLLHGPPGCGKTMLAGALANDLGVPFLSLASPSVVSGTSGESERTIRETFEKAKAIAPSILFLDEIDAITPKRETAGREMERRIVATMLTCMDDLSIPGPSGTSEDSNDLPRHVIVMGATNRPDALDPALRRAGRFDHEIALGVPDEDGREQILRVLCSQLRLSGSFDFRALAKATPGYVGADLTALTGAAGVVAVKRIYKGLTEAAVQSVGGVDSLIQQTLNMASDSPIPATDDDIRMDGAEDPAQTVAQIPPATNGTLTEEPAAPPNRYTLSSSSILSSLPTSLTHSPIAMFLRSHPDVLTSSQLAPLELTQPDFLTALPTVQPSSKREGFATVPDVTWSDVGALHTTREELSMAIVQPIRRPELFAAVGVSASSGVLLWGPPGCGKTLLAKAVANESGANFISVKGPELLNKYVGESERAVRQVFARARTSSPCVIFFDELDALVPRRDEALSESSARVVNTLLTELDGLETRVQTFIIGATNRPDMIDPAMCRPGRLDKLLYVDLPSPSERAEILRTVTKRTPLDADVDLEAVALHARATNYSGADLAALVREAAVAALKEALRSPRSDALGVPASYDARELPRTREDQHAAAPAVLVRQAHFLAALDKVQPSVSAAQRRNYLEIRQRMAGGDVGSGESGMKGERRGKGAGAGAGGRSWKDGSAGAGMGDANADQGGAALAT